MFCINANLGPKSIEFEKISRVFEETTQEEIKGLHLR